MPAPSSAYVRNAWYMAAWAEEVPEGGFLARRLLDRPWLVMRLADGSWAMLADRCPHRFAPLSMGERVGDTLRCAYHG
ncbi:MAG: Rieske 2Fe-2S domain-containing protein, partial [Novosphingobium sp.]